MSAYEGDLILEFWQPLCPGDEVCASGAIRDLHRAHPGRFRTCFRARVPEIFYHNPYITPQRDLINPRHIQWSFSIQGTNDRRLHFIECWTRNLERHLGIPIPMTEPKGDLYLTQEEIDKPIRDLIGHDGPYWIMAASHKTDCRTKWVPTETWQPVVDGLKGKVQFVRAAHKPTIRTTDRDFATNIGGRHFVPELHGIIDIQGKTGIRDMMRLVYHSAGVLCPITFAQHLCAALPRPDLPIRPCVVIAGGREGQFITQSQGMHMLHTAGALTCCKSGGCWKSHTAPVGALSDRCHSPVDGYAECMRRISPELIIATIKSLL